MKHSNGDYSQAHISRYLSPECLTIEKLCYYLSQFHFSMLRGKSIHIEIVVSNQQVKKLFGFDDM